MGVTILTGVVTLLGIISTLVAWRYNPKRRIHEELDAIFKELDTLYIRRDKALQNHNTDELTICVSLIVKLCSRKTILLQRLGTDIYGQGKDGSLSGS